MESTEQPTHMSPKPWRDLRLGGQGWFGAMTCSAERSHAMTHGVVGLVIYESFGDCWGFLSKAAECVGNMKKEPASKTAALSSMSTQLKQRLTQAGVKEGWARHGLNQLSLPLK